jgi:AcrR family transcriptional regulator
MASRPEPRPGPGRPSTGARERILAAALEVLKRDGYGGLTTAKVGVASGQNKALINYHFGSKQGLVAEVARQVADTITEEVLRELPQPRTAAELVEGLVDAIWRVMERDEGIPRVYFDLTSQSVVEPQVRKIMAELKAGFRTVLRGLLREIEDAPTGRQADAAAVFLTATIEGLAQERLDRGETPELRRARAMFIRSAPEAIRT